ncbi:MAG: alpha/beta fold hydrolase [Xanthomonadales bacterium]|jgi:pimeloyl-ACP methyl ester carboxylesterase|nr:alpha/beta fold hydrolase [Xanthomonadales bacterium]
MMREEVILVHGLWFGPWAFRLLARRLRQGGFEVQRFRYRSTQAYLSAHARSLQAVATASKAERLNFVAHSLGGLVTLRMLSETRGLPPGRIVLLGSPLRGSGVARKSRKVPGSQRLFGRIRPALVSGYDRLATDRETGMIAGSAKVGLGGVVGGTGGPGDGTVSIRETQVEGLRDHLVLPVSHTGMVFSAEAARQAIHFLRFGSFKRLSA